MISGPSSQETSDETAGRLPVSYTLQIAAHKDGWFARADIWLIVAATEEIAGKSMKELDRTIQSMRQRMGVFARSLLENAAIY